MFVFSLSLSFPILQFPTPLNFGPKLSALGRGLIDLADQFYCYGCHADKSQRSRRFPNLGVEVDYLYLLEFLRNLNLLGWSLHLLEVLGPVRIGPHYGS